MFWDAVRRLLISFRQGRRRYLGPPGYAVTGPGIYFMRGLGLRLLRLDFLTPGFPACGSLVVWRIEIRLWRTGLWRYRRRDERRGILRLGRCRRFRISTGRV